MEFGLDFAWGDLSPQAVRAVGAKFIANYLSWDRPKDLLPAEARMWTAAGIHMVVVWESTAKRAEQGYQAGVDDAHEALRQAQACGMPPLRPIYFAVDDDTTVAAVRNYFRGVGTVLGAHRVGVYGGYWIVKGLLDEHLVGFAWQTYAWSGGMWDHRAHIRQFSNNHYVGGVDCDFDYAMRPDYGAWVIGERAPRHDPYWFLLPDEEKWVREFVALRSQKGPLASRRRKVIQEKLIVRRKQVWVRATGERHGWAVLHRGLRYQLLLSLTKEHGRKLQAA